MNEGWLNRAKKAKNDEFYTPRWYAEEMIKNVDLKGKKIICPCDGEESEIYKVIKEKGYDVEYSKGDYKSVNYEKYDIIITNPPFSIWRKFMEDIRNTGKDYIIVGSINGVTYKDTFALLKEEKEFCSVAKTVEYHNGVPVSSRLYSNLDIYDSSKRDLNFEKPKYVKTDHGDYSIKRITNIGWDDDIYVTIGIFDYNWRKYFDFVNKEIEGLYINGKRSYARWKIKRKSSKFPCV